MAEIAAAVIRGRKKRVQSQDEFMREILDDFFESEDGSKAAERAKADMLDITDITMNRAYGPKIRPSSVPERAAGISDFFYGDKREALASQSELVAQLFDHCWGGPFELTNFDWNCWSPFDEQFIEMFGAYGMNGTIKMGNGSRSTMNLVEVPFCGITPNGIRGLRVVRWEGDRFVTP